MKIGFIACGTTAESIFSLRDYKIKIQRALVMPLPASRFFALLLAGASFLASPATAQSIPPDQKPLYELETDCSIKQGPIQKCLVDVYDQGTITYYRHRIGNQVELIRISDDPENRIERFNPQTKTWKSVASASAQFSTNTVCFNGREFCVVNPNFLSSLYEQRPGEYGERDLVKVVFDAGGRVKTSCFDDGCGQAIGAGL